MKPAKKFDGRPGRAGVCSRVLTAFVLLFVSGIAVAQTAAWPIATLQPPGFEVPYGPLAGIATTGQLAVTAYGPTDTIGYRVFARKRVAGTWQAPELVAQGPISDGSPRVVVADGDNIVVGLPEASIYGRADIYRRDDLSSTWALEQSLTSAPPVGWQQFGGKLSMRKSLLVVGSRFGWGERVETFRRDSVTGTWQDAGFTSSNSSGLSGTTDGNRIAVCGTSTCSTVKQDAAGTWQNEGWLPGSNSGALVDGEWLLATSYTAPGYALKAYKWAAGQWQFQQNVIAMPSSSKVVGGAGTVAFLDTGSVVRVISLNSDGVWRAEASLNMPEGGNYRVDLAGDVVLADTQSFAGNTNGWIPTGTVEGIPNVTGTGFGSAVEIVGDRVWIGSPGHSSDYRSGAVWLQALNGIIPASPSELIVPPQPSIGTLLGGAFDSDGVRVAVASYGQSSNGKTAVRVYDAITPISQGIALSVPPLSQWVGNVDVAIKGEIVALARKGSGALIVDVFRKDGSAYPLAQTIIPPTLPYGSQGSGGANIVLSDQWLLAGRRRYQLAAGMYVDRGDLVLPLDEFGVVYDFTQIVEGPGFVVAPALSDDVGMRLGAVFASDPAEGWIYRGAVQKAAPDTSVCKTMSASESAIVCMSINSDQLRVAEPDGATGNWRVVGSATVPGAVISPYTLYPLDVAGDKVVVGLPNDARVVILSLSEAIFGSGFDG